MRPTILRVIAVAVTALAIATAASAGPPGNPGNPADAINNPHPGMPWNTYNAQGQVVRYIQVPAQQVEIEVPVNVPAGVPPETQKQVVEIPGYVVTETTTGFIYPDRWTLQQTGAGTFQWQHVPSAFQRK
jgi:hypothetical protein